MALQTMIENLNKAKQAYETQLAAIGADAQKAVAEFLAPNIPPGYALWWTQYTPYFNDGEACTFGVGDVYLVPSSKLEEVRRRNDGERIGMGLYTAITRYGQPDVEKSYETTDYSKPTSRSGYGSFAPTTYAKKTVTYIEPGFAAIEGYSVEKLEALSKVWQALPEDLMENAFGDHVRCYVTAEGVAEVSEYDHD